jgi:hypothetical protein
VTLVLEGEIGVWLAARAPSASEIVPLRSKLDISLISDERSELSVAFSDSMSGSPQGTRYRWNIPNISEQLDRRTRKIAQLPGRCGSSLA